MNSTLALGQPGRDELAPQCQAHQARNLLDRLSSAPHRKGAGQCPCNPQMIPGEGCNRKYLASHKFVGHSNNRRYYPGSLQRRVWQDRGEEELEPMLPCVALSECDVKIGKKMSNSIHSLTRTKTHAIRIFSAISAHRILLFEYLDFSHAISNMPLSLGGTHSGWSW